MGIKPQDRPKLIGIVTALIGVLVYVLIVLVPKLSAKASPAHSDPPANLTAVSATGTSANGGSAAGGDASAAIPDSDELPVPPSPHRDSFTPPPTIGKGQQPGPPQAGMGQAAAGATTGPGPALGPGPTLTAAMPVQAPAAPAAPPAPPLPPVELKGVILGDPAVAVLSVNGEVVQRQVGDAIVGSLKLAKISDEGITVEDGKKYIPVAVGHIMPGTSLQVQPAH